MADMRSFDRLHALLLQTLQRLREVRTRLNRVYTLVDAALSAFAVFLMQAPSLKPSARRGHAVTRAVRGARRGGRYSVIYQPRRSHCQATQLSTPRMAAACSATCHSGASTYQPGIGGSTKRPSASPCSR